jgi:photosystem II stability/assembly factor-like uncharacterized protein
MKKIFLLLLSCAFISTVNSQWVQQTSGLTSSLNGIFFTDASTGYIAGDAGKILKTTNGGTNWNSLTSGTTSFLYSVSFPSASIGYVVGGSGTIRKTTNGGTNWSGQTSNTGNYLYGVYFTSTSIGYAVGASGTIVKTSNGGTLWSVKTSGTTKTLNSVFFTSSTTGYAVGGTTSSIILKTTDGGSTWDSLSCSATNSLRSVYFTGVDTGYVAGYGGKIYKTTNGGTTWIEQNSTITGNIHSIFFPTDNTGYAVCNAGYVLKTTNGGATWAASLTIVSEVLLSAYFPGVNTGYVCGGAGTIIKTATGGESCTITTNAGNDQTICNGQSATLTATGGSTYSWSNGGSTASITVSPSSTTTYTVTATATNGCTATDKAIINVTAGGAASVSIADNPIGSICSGTSVTYTATPTNGGTPTYQWKLNGSNISGATNSTYITTTIASGDNITCIMTSSLSCATGSPATSNTITKTVFPSVPVSINISANPSGGMCTGTSVTFTATPTNGGASPSYQWKKNGSNISGATTTTYTSSTLSNGDIITCMLTSTVTCASGNPATSNSITMSIASSLAAGVSIAASPSGAICSGTNVTFTATATNGGSPTYQWKKNGTNISAATNSTYSSSTLAGGDNITCSMTSSLSCATGSPATSNTITMAVNANVTAGVSIGANPGTSICEGTSVTFTATPANGGTSPAYQWKNNGSIIGGATNSTFTSSTLANGNAITCVMTSNASCVSGSPASSNSLTMTINPILPASISITASPGTTICSGISVAFTATQTNGGTTPAYQWQSNGSAISGATNSTYTSSTFTNGDVITCILSSSLTCVSGSPATSNTLTITVNTTTADAGADTIICPGGTATLTATGGISYQWSTIENTQSITVTPIATATYYVTVTANGCSDTDDVTVTVNTVAASAGTDQTICIGDVATLSASGGGTYYWNNGLATSSISVSPVTTTLYTVTVTNGGCTGTDNVLVTVTSATANAGSDQTVCAGDNVILSASGGVTYEWDNGVTDNDPFIPDSTQTYTVTVTDQNGCTATDDVTVTVILLPPTPVITQDGYVLTSNADSLNQWYMNDSLLTGATDTTYTATESGDYYVIVTTNGCSSDTSNLVSIVVGISEIDQDNYFSIYPNPARDKIEVSLAEKSEIEILNLNGQIVYYQNTGKKHTSIDISGLATGVYYVRAKTANGIYIQKFVKE